MFSTSERWDESPALAVRAALRAENVRGYNPRNKTAAEKGSPVYELLGLISYLIDPVTKAPVGKNGRHVEVAASMNETTKSAAAITEPPRGKTGRSYPISQAHLGYQRGFIKEDGTIERPGPNTAPLLQYIAQIRDQLAQANEDHAAGRAKNGPRLTLAGLIARLLSFPRYRNSGFTESLFRQALFTTLLEAHTAPTRRTMAPLDAPLQVTRNAAGKFVWANQYWDFLNYMGSYLDNASIDDPEVEAFEENAVLLLTFHQAKGLEFDHVYVAGTGRSIDLSPVLRTKLFSGETPGYQVDSGTGAVASSDPDVQRLARADREREVYVALTRAKETLTLLLDPTHDFEFLNLNPAIANLFEGRKVSTHPLASEVEVLEYKP